MEFERSFAVLREITIGFEPVGEVSGHRGLLVKGAGNAWFLGPLI
jgi:hypothetical protein